MSRIGELRARLAAAGQGHLLEGFERLSAAQQARYLQQVESLDLALVRRLCDQHLTGAPEPLDPDAIEPIDSVPLPASMEEARPAEERGEAALRAGQVAVLLVAGGQGSRLGFDRPKGCYRCMPVSDKSLFQVHAERVLAISRRYGRPVPYYIMTSQATHADTVAFFEENAFFGLPRADVRFFQQGVLPAVDLQGRVIRAGPDRLFFSPNGHGGVLAALRDSGALDDMVRRGLSTVFYHQVDNPLVKVCDPWFLGQHLLASSEFSLKVIPKNGPFDKLGNVCRYRGRPTIIEYSDLPEALAERRRADGRLWLEAGSIAIHVFAVDFLRRLTQGPLPLPVHAARKRIPFDASGRAIQPEKENGLKFEMFVFDALPLAQRALVVETTRREEYEALKNASGEHSPETVRRAVSNVFADWLRACGAVVPTDPDGNASLGIEISPLYALDARELARKLPPGLRLDRPLYLG